MSVTPQNSERARSLLDKDAGAPVQSRQGAGARGRLSALTGPPGLNSAQRCSSVFSFSFIPRAKTFIEKCRKMLKL